MALVDYSDSDASEVEEQLVTKPAESSSKAGFQKVVDRSNPGKIRLSLPQPTAPKEPTHEDAPPAKRVKTGGGAFSGFNSFLPAPKRTGPANTTLGGGALKKGGLGACVNLKTGAAPGFSREPEPESETHAFPPSTASEAPVQTPADQVKLVGKPLMFRPLSVAKRPKEKKQTATNIVKEGTHKAPATAVPETPAPRPKVSLFSMSMESDDLPTTTLDGEYKPMMVSEVGDGEDDDEALDQSSFTPSYEDHTPNTSFSVHLPPVPTPPVSQSLDDVAGDLNLSAAERRQLFGRQKGGRNQAATKIINFNTDQEYMHNEELRATGEQVSHNPVRAIAPGKHSLKQLVNAAQSQKEALEESFAKGKNNRAETSSRYGW